jgi:hypothetical protein
MRIRVILPLALLVALGVGAPAQAAYVVGVGDQSVQIFEESAFKRLNLKRVRYIVPWDWSKSDAQVQEIATYMNAARASKMDVLVTFTASRGCFNGRTYSRRSSCRAPSANAYKQSLLRFDKAYPWVRAYQAWNEINHVSQPTHRSPTLAARYWNVLRRYERAKRFRGVAGDFLDNSDVGSYATRFLRAARGKPRLWGLHNYKDVNRRQSKGLTTLLRLLPGELWLTETGGIVQFGNDFPYSESRAANRTRYMFQLANRYDSRLRGNRSRLTRVYVYRWFGGSREERFDAGLVDPDGSPRQGYSVFRDFARRARK